MKMLDLIRNWDLVRLCLVAVDAATTILPFNIIIIIIIFALVVDAALLLLLPQVLLCIALLPIWLTSLIFLSF